MANASKGSRLFTEYANMIKGFKTVEEKLMNEEEKLNVATKDAKQLSVKIRG